MAIQESDREDLMREAVQYRERIQLRCLLREAEVVFFCGRRADGRVSVYWSQVEVYQFDTDSRLRRVFLGDVRYAVSGDLWVRLERTSRGGRVQFARREVEQEELTRLVRRWQDVRQWLKHAVASGQVKVEKAIPAGEQLPEWFQDFLCDSGLDEVGNPSPSE